MTKPPRVPAKGVPAPFCRECLATLEYNRQYPEYPRLYCSSCGRSLPAEAK